MIPRLPGPPRDQPPPLVLVADEDPRLVETLALALQSSHFRVITALDGEDALRRARAEPPELVIAGVRLARRSGLELCDTLRRELDHGDIPILLLATATDPESRVEALAHGADDMLVKPFLARELVARAQRLVLRARQSARHLKRSLELERDLQRIDQELRGARSEAARERALRVLAGGMFGELLRTLDLEQLDARLLREACRQTGARSAVLLAPDPAGAWVSVAVRGDLPERWAAFTLPAAASCLDWLRTLGQPVRREDLERLPGMKGELVALATHGVAILALLSGADGVEAVLACEDRPDGAPIGPPERERLAVLCAAAAPARVAARRFREHQERALDLLSTSSSNDPRRSEASRETLERLLPVADTLGVHHRERLLLEQALRLGPWVWTDLGRAALSVLSDADPTRRLEHLRALTRDAEACALGEPAASEDVLAWLAATGLRYQALRISGRSAFESWCTSARWLRVQVHPELRDRFPEAIEPAR